MQSCHPAGKEQLSKSIMAILSLHSKFGGMDGLGIARLTTIEPAQQASDGNRWQPSGDNQARIWGCMRLDWRLTCGA
jgi:hypothetical protein